MNSRSYSLLVLALLGASCAAYTPTTGYKNRRQVTEPCPAVLPLSKVMMNQSNYVQYVYYATPIPDLQSFTLQYWFNLYNADRISTTFDYTVRGPTNSTIRINLQRGQPQRWFLYINEILVSNVISPLIRTGEWHFMVHSWNSWTGSWSIYMDGVLLQAGSSPEGRGLVVRGGGEAYSGQRQNTDDGMDRGEGLEGWMTLFQMSVRPLLNPASPQTLRMVSRLASSCNGQFNGDLISWSRTPRKGYGGPQETPARPVCGNF
ncbi:C-reactive protein 1.4-like [Palaemon carinicauda]|uniref:C-reactive protein 1.4-like n=1 Tax=Palaemon carinicauda TaxID=392227 RepID=UPI0035B659F7